MVNTSGGSTPSRLGGICYAPISLDVYLCDYKYFLDTQRFEAMPSNGDAETIYGVCNGADFNTALGACTRRWAHWDGLGAVLRTTAI